MEMKQTIACPNCEGVGWLTLRPPTAPRQRFLECPMCIRKGYLIIDECATAALPDRPRPHRAHRVIIGTTWRTKRDGKTRPTRTRRTRAA